jgi:hypothetical protein
MVSGDEEVKLLLEAFQMSVSTCLSHPSIPVLRAQMLGRLMSVRQSELLQVALLHCAALQVVLRLMRCWR